jgi:hypothetical protein
LRSISRRNPAQRNEYEKHFRAKELNRRSAFPAKEVGKRTMDAWNHERVYVDKPVPGDGCVTSLAEFVLSVKITPLDFTITNDFLNALTEEERDAALFFTMPRKKRTQKSIFLNLNLLSLTGDPSSSFYFGVKAGRQSGFQEIIFNKFIRS